MMSNDDEMCAKILEVILFKIHSIQETFFEHKSILVLETQQTMDQNFVASPTLRSLLSYDCEGLRKGGFPYTVW